MKEVKRLHLLNAKRRAIHNSANSQTFLTSYLLLLKVWASKFTFQMFGDCVATDRQPTHKTQYVSNFGACSL